MRHFLGLFCAAIGGILLGASCAIPSVQGIDVSGCIRRCNADNDQCLAAVGVRVTFCQSIQAGEDTAAFRQDCLFGTNGYKGYTSVLDMYSACYHTDQDCIAVCIADVETRLGKK